MYKDYCKKLFKGQLGCCVSYHVAVLQRLKCCNKILALVMEEGRLIDDLITLSTAIINIYSTKKVCV